MINRNGKPLRSLHFDRIWPTLSPEHLSYLELKQDPYFSYIPKRDILPCLTPQSPGDKRWRNIRLNTRIIKIYSMLAPKRFERFAFVNNIQLTLQVRAQYIHQNATIDIYHELHSTNAILFSTIHHRCG